MECTWCCNNVSFCCVFRAPWEAKVLNFRLVSATIWPTCPWAECTASCKVQWRNHIASETSPYCTYVQHVCPDVSWAYRGIISNCACKCKWSWIINYRFEALKTARSSDSAPAAAWRPPNYIIVLIIAWPPQQINLLRTPYTPCTAVLNCHYWHYIIVIGSLFTASSPTDLHPLSVSAWMAILLEASPASWKSFDNWLTYTL